MKKILVMGLVFCFVLNAPAMAGLDGKKAAYQGGTTKDKDFPGAKENVVGILNTSEEKELQFEYTLNKVSKTYSIPYDQFIDIGVWAKSRAKSWQCGCDSYSNQSSRFVFALFEKTQTFRNHRL